MWEWISGLLPSKWGGGGGEYKNENSKSHCLLANDTDDASYDDASHGLGIFAVLSLHYNAAKWWVESDDTKDSTSGTGNTAVKTKTKELDVTSPRSWNTWKALSTKPGLELSDDNGVRLTVRDKNVKKMSVSEKSQSFSYGKATRLYDIASRY